MKKKRSWKTTVLGSLAAILLALSQAGVKVGRVGNTDFVALGAAVAVAAGLGAARDHSVSDEDAGAK